jgi:hypothetical protein
MPEHFFRQYLCMILLDSRLSVETGRELRFASFLSGMATKIPGLEIRKQFAVFTDLSTSIRFTSFFLLYPLNAYSRTTLNV